MPCKVSLFAHAVDEKVTSPPLPLRRRKQSKVFGSKTKKSPFKQMRFWPDFTVLSVSPPPAKKTSHRAKGFNLVPTPRGRCENAGIPAMSLPPFFSLSQCHFAVILYWYWRKPGVRFSSAWASPPQLGFVVRSRTGARRKLWRLLSG